jgi:hypothetical protein
VYICPHTDALFMDFDDAMHDGYVSALDLEHDDFPDAERTVSKPEE